MAIELDRAAAAVSQAEAIRREIRNSGIPRPVLRDTGQAPVADVTPITRTSSTAAWLIDYQAAALVTPDADTPPWTAHVTGAATAQIV